MMVGGVAGWLIGEGSKAAMLTVNFLVNGSAEKRKKRERNQDYRRGQGTSYKYVNVYTIISTMDVDHQHQSQSHSHVLNLFYKTLSQICQFVNSPSTTSSKSFLHLMHLSTTLFTPQTLYMHICSAPSHSLTGRWKPATRLDRTRNNA